MTGVAVGVNAFPWCGVVDVRALGRDKCPCVAVREVEPIETRVSEGAMGAFITAAPSSLTTVSYASVAALTSLTGAPRHVASWLSDTSSTAKAGPEKNAAVVMMRLRLMVAPWVS